MTNPKTVEFIKHMNYKIMILANKMDNKEVALAYGKQLCRENMEWLRREDKKSEEAEKEAYLEQHNDSSYADKQADYAA